MPSSSMSRIVSSLQEYQSTILRRFSAVTASRSTPSPRRSARTASGDWLETTTSPLPPDFRPSARKVRAKRSFSWPGGPWRMTLDPTGRPPWTIASKPSMPVASRVMRSRFQRSGEAATDGEVRIHAHGVPQGRLEDALRGVRSQALGADGPEVSVNLGDELSEIVQAPSRPVDHLLEDGLPQFLMVRRQPVLHLRLDRRRTEVADSFEEGVEICDVEVNHFAQRRRVVHEIDVEAEAGRSQAILERPRIVLSSFDQAELQKRCKNFDAVVMWMSRERATSLERCQFASRRDRKMERLCSPERSTMARWNVCWSIGGCLHRNAPETPRTLWTVELGVHKLSPGILTHEYCRPERTIATIRCHEETWGFESGSRRRTRRNETESRR